MFSHRVTIHIIIVLFAVVKSAKILVISPVPMFSHQLVFRALIQELINRDHELTVLTTDPLYPQGGSPNNLREIDLHDLSYTLCSKLMNKFAKTDINNLDKIRIAYRLGSEMFIEQLKSESVRKLLSDNTMKFDLVITENCVPASLIFSHIFKAPLIFMSPFGALPGNMKIIGSETHPLLHPTHYHKKMYNLTNLDKLREMYVDVTYNNVHDEQEVDDGRMLKSVFGIDTPVLNEMKNNVHVLFLNVHPLWLHNPPASPNVVYTWGFDKQLEKKLPNDLQSYLDSSSHGVVYISFGSVLKTSEIPPHKRKIFLKAFSRLPYNILWKWDADELPGKSENIKISKWFPQYDVLRHPNLKCFITHGGVQSTNEAIHAGVPLIGIPQFSDQEYNTEKYKYFKIGIKLDYESLTIDRFENAIKNISSNYDSYKKNIIQLRTLMYDQPQPPLESVMWRIEYLLRHGGVQHLRAPAANMSWVEYYELELVLIVLSEIIVLGTVLLVALYTCLRDMFRFICLKMNQSKEHTKIK